MKKNGKLALVVITALSLSTSASAADRSDRSVWHCIYKIAVGQACTG